MNLVDQITLPAVLTAIGMVAGLVIAGTRLSARLGVLEFKVATMWNFQVRRGFSEVVSTGIGSFGSPLHFNQEVQSALDPIRADLLAFGQAHLNSHTPDEEALLLLEAEFGDQLLHIICVPFGLSHGACLLLALTAATGRNEIELPAIKPPRTSPNWLWPWQWPRSVH
jgi:hypothetical protein